jgi:hypothetical protein
MARFAPSHQARRHATSGHSRPSRPLRRRPPSRWSRAMRARLPRALRSPSPGTGFIAGASVVIGHGNGRFAGTISATKVTLVSPTEITATTGVGPRRVRSPSSCRRRGHQRRHRWRQLHVPQRVRRYGLNSEGQLEVDALVQRRRRGRLSPLPPGLNRTRLTTLRRRDRVERDWADAGPAL